MKKVKSHFEKHIWKYLWGMIWTALVFKAFLLLLISLWYFRSGIQQKIFAEEDTVNFFTVTWAELSTEYISNTWTLLWFSSWVFLNVDSCDYRINTWDWANTTWIVYSWDQIVLKDISSDSYDNITSCLLTLGEYETSFYILTKDEVVRDSLVFQSITWVDLWVEYISETWFILEWTGIVVSVSSWFYSVNTGWWITWESILNSWDYFHLKLLSSNQFNALNFSILSLDNLDLYFEVKTKNEPIDDIVDSFVFISKTGIELDTYVESEIIPILWINTWVFLSVSGLEYSLNWDLRKSDTGIVFNWDVIQVRILSSNEWLTISSSSLFIWDTEVTYQVETKVMPFILDITPNSFSFTNISDAELDSPYPTPLFEISGINTGINIYVESWYYRINDGDWVVDTWIVYSGDMIQILVISSDTYSTNKVWNLYLWDSIFWYNLITKDEPIIVATTTGITDTWIVYTWILDTIAPEITWFMMTWTVSWLDISFVSDEDSIFSFSYLMQSGTNFSIFSWFEYTTGHSFELSWFVTWFVYNYALVVQDATWNTFDDAGWFIFENLSNVQYVLGQFNENDIVEKVNETTSVIDLFKLEIEKYNTCKDNIKFFSEQYDVEDVLLTVRIPVFEDMFLSTVIDVFTSLVINTLWTQWHLSEDEMNDVVWKYENFATVLKIVRDSDDVCEHSLSNYHITMFQKALEKYGIFLDWTKK